MNEYRDAAKRLLLALSAQMAAKAASDHARDALDDRRAELIRSGQGQPRERCAADEREAHLQGQLKDELERLRQTRDELRRAETELESARVCERTAREALRLNQAASDQRPAAS